MTAATQRAQRRSRSLLVVVSLVFAVDCGSTEKQAVSTSSAVPDAFAIRRRLDRERVTLASFPRKVLYSWTKDKGARWLATTDPPRLLRVEIRKRPPDDAWYDVHLRASDDVEMRTLLSSPRFDHVRWTWTNVWGACDGLENERYGDQLVRIELKDDAIFAVFVPKTDDGLPNGGKDESNPFRLGMPEWSFVDLKGAPVAREAVLAHPERLAAVMHHSPSRLNGAWAGLREVVLVNEAEIERWSLGDDAALAALDDGARLVSDLSKLGVVPKTRADDADFVSRLMLQNKVDSSSPMDVESAWMLTLPFPRARYRDLDRIAALLESARSAQHFHRVVIVAAQ
jgi:hypothetical protein